MKIEIELTEKQEEQVDKYLQEHYCDEFKKNSGGFGSKSKLVFIIGVTSIGNTVDILCPYCNHRESITDIDTW